MAVVAGVQMVTGLNTARSLAEAGIRVIGLTDNPSAPASQTSFCEKFYCPDLHSEGLVRTLCELGETIGRRSVLYLTSDQQVRIVSGHRDTLARHYHLTFPDQDVCDLLLSKAMFFRYARQHDFPIPQSFEITRGSDFEADLQTLMMPCIVKPIGKFDVWESRYKAVKAIKVIDRSRLAGQIREALDCVDRLIVQEWIPGTDGDVYFDLVYFDEQSRCREIFSGRKIRQWPPLVGNTSSAEPSDRTEQQEATIRLFTQLGFTGLGSMEYKLDRRDMTMKLIEPTVGRPDLQSYISVANGVNLPALAYSELTGIRLQNPPVSADHKTVKWICEWEEFESAKQLVSQGDLTWGDWLKSLSGPRKYALYTGRDKAPFLRTLSTRIMAKFRKTVDKRGQGESPGS